VQVRESQRSKTKAIPRTANYAMIQNAGFGKTLMSCPP